MTAQVWQISDLLTPDGPQEQPYLDLNDWIDVFSRAS